MPALYRDEMALHVQSMMDGVDFRQGLGGEINAKVIEDSFVRRE
jgi:hypothetical protein